MLLKCSKTHSHIQIYSPLNFYKGACQSTLHNVQKIVFQESMTTEMHPPLHFILWAGELCQTWHDDENVLLENEIIMRRYVLICSSFGIIEYDVIRVVFFN